VVIDRALLSSRLRAGNVLSGWFWLSGRVQTAAASKPTAGWLRRIYQS
jgi:hypothetical protein